MSNSKELILAVTGATGTQGRAVISALASRNAASATPSSLVIRALVRDPSASRSKALLEFSDRNTSVLLVQADFGSSDSLRSACAPDEAGKHVNAVFLNTNPTSGDAEEEIRHASAVLEAAKEGKVQHIVYSSVLAITDEDNEVISRIGAFPSWVDPAAIKALSPAHLPPTEHIRRKSNLLRSIPSDGPTRKLLQGYFGAKVQIEYLVATWGGTWSVLRPGWFMTNFLPPSSLFYFPELAAEQPVLRSAISKESRMMLVDPEDIGAIGARALLDPLLEGEMAEQSLTNKTVNVGSEVLDLDATGRVLSNASGSNVKVEYVSEQDAEREVMEGSLQRDGQAWHSELQDCFEPSELEIVLGRKPRTFSEFLERYSEKGQVKLRA